MTYRFATRARGPLGLPWLLLTSVLALSLVLVACDGDEDADGTPATDATPTATEDGATPDDTTDGTATPASDGAATAGEPSSESEEARQQYGEALQLALQQEIGSEDAQSLIDEWNIDVTPDGEGLPEGSGTVEEGSQVYQAQCAACHGQELGGGIGPQLVSDEPGTVWEPGDTPTVGNWWPYATTVWDYINRAMPFYEPGTLSPDEVYAVTAFILAENEVIEADQELNQDTLPDVEMPARDIYNECHPDRCYEEYGQDGGD